jgi:hypothetical protein
MWSKEMRALVEYFKKDPWAAKVLNEVLAGKRPVSELVEVKASRGVR